MDGFWPTHGVHPEGSDGHVHMYFPWCPLVASWKDLANAFRDLVL